VGVEKPTVKNVVHGMPETCTGFGTRQGVSDAEKETQKTLDQMLYEIPTDEGQNFFDKYNIPNTKGDSPNFLAAPGLVRQLTHQKKTGSADDTQGKTTAAHPRRCDYLLKYASAICL
jgi:hypothetical protein